MPKVLIVEDQPAVAKALRMLFDLNDIEAVATESPEAAVKAVERREVDLVLQDMNFSPGETSGEEGIALFRRVRAADPDLPILLITAWTSLETAVKLVKEGANDYLAKPFSPRELLARIRAALRRAQPAESEPVVSTGRFTIDLAAKRVSMASGPVRLTPTEWHLLEILARHAGKLVTRQQLLTEVWGPAYAKETNYLRVYMSQIRQKLEADPSHPVHIITEPGMGYRFES